jgi:hypothetical protein
MTWKPDDGSLSYAYIRELEQELYGEWFTVDELPSKADEERLRPIKLARALEVERHGVDDRLAAAVRGGMMETSPQPKE